MFGIEGRRFLSSPPPPRSYSPPPHFSPFFLLTPGVLLRSPAFRSLVRWQTLTKTNSYIQFVMVFFLTHMNKRSQRTPGKRKSYPKWLRSTTFVFVEGSTFLCFVIKPRYHITRDDEIWQVARASSDQIFPSVKFVRKMSERIRTTPLQISFWVWRPSFLFQKMSSLVNRTWILGWSVVRPEVWAWYTRLTYGGDARACRAIDSQNRAVLSKCQQS